MNLKAYAPRIIELARRVGPDRYAIASHVGLTFQQLDNIITRYCKTEYRNAVDEWHDARRNMVEAPVFELPPPVRAITRGAVHPPPSGER